ncbi:MAG: proton-conducting transporter membrane subunit [Alphaproteobacteria bacterium]
MIPGLLAAFFLLCGAGAVLAFLTPVRWNPSVLAVFGSLAALVAMLVGASALVAGTSFRVELWPVLSLGTLALGADRLTGLFLFVTGVVFLPVSIFSGSYLKKYLERYSLRYFSALYHALLASIVLVLVADDTISFLAAWEAMSIVSYLLVTYDYEREESSHAGFVMLAMGEAGTIAVAIAFLLAANSAGTLDFDGLRAAPRAFGDEIGWAVFLLSFFGFAVKAGLVPVNSWLPLAHPVAPTNVSALLSAVIVNLGIYGIVRFNLDLVPATGDAPGLIVLVIGSISALVGILYATIQAEMKSLLAHSTIENMGIVAASIGAAMVFLATGHQVVAGIALIAGLYHLVNHSVYKALLFIGTGAVEAGAGTRDLDRLGGIIGRMPWTSVFFLIGVMSISALPPLNGFVSEWLTLQTVLRSALISSTAIKIVFAVSGALLALTAGLAVTCFVKVFAMGFLGMPRSEGAAHAVEARSGTRVPLALLAASCIALGVLPTYVIPVLDRAASPLAHASATAALVPPFFSEVAQRRENIPPAFLAEFHDLGAQVGGDALPGRGLVVLHRGEVQNPVVFAMSTSYTLLAFAALLAVVFVAFRLLARGRTLARGAVWDGGLRRLWPEITYTATGFSNPVRVVFQAVLSPVAVEDSTEAVAQHFRTAIRREHTEVHIVDRLVLGPPVHALRRVADVVRKMHVGHVNAYAAYVLLTLLLVLLIGAGIR